MGTMRNGEREPMRAAFATLLWVAPVKKAVRLSPRNTPGMNAWRTCLRVTRRPVVMR
jgi:hypothetical protein